jgi:hypothetical protein
MPAVTVASLATPRGPDRVPSSAIDLEYRPGVCNIGPAEIARRRRSGITASVATVALLTILVAIGAPGPLRLVLFVPAAVAAAGFLQAWLRFCAGFGAIGVRNFGDVGTTDEIVDPEARARDRRRAIEIGAASGVVGAVVAISAVLSPV